MTSLRSTRRLLARCFLASGLICCSRSLAASETLGPTPTEVLAAQISNSGVEGAHILGFDSRGVPLLCSQDAPPRDQTADTTTADPNATALAAPPSTRSFESVPGVIRNDGTDSFRLE